MLHSNSCKTQTFCALHLPKNIFICMYAECTATDLTDLGTTMQNGTVDQRCQNMNFENSSSITNGVVCYNGTTEGSIALYICDNITQQNEVTRVCQSDGTWTGTIPSCPGIILYSQLSIS